MTMMNAPCLLDLQRHNLGWQSHGKDQTLKRLSTSSPHSAHLGRRRLTTWCKLALILLLLIPYAMYLVYVVRAGNGPIDYETFMQIGGSLLAGQEVYGENSYYPLPYVAIFALFRAMPKPLSLILWLGFPVSIALAASGFLPCVLLFAPVFSHFAGGQASIVGLLGFWGYRKNLVLDDFRGGAFLAITMLKPQLGLVPLGYAIYRWCQHYLKEREVPRQLYGFALVSLGMYLPTLLVRPTWPIEWLTTPRPLFERALSAMVPRLMLGLLSPGVPAFWAIWGLTSFGLLALIWRQKASGHPLDILVLWSFVVSPVLHDYDLIELIPIIRGRTMWLMAVLLSIPGWWTITTHYGDDAAWITFTVIAPGLLVAYLIQTRSWSAFSRRGPSMPEAPS